VQRAGKACSDVLYKYLCFRLSVCKHVLSYSRLALAVLGSCAGRSARSHYPDTGTPTPEIAAASLVLYAGPGMIGYRQELWITSASASILQPSRGWTPGCLSPLLHGGLCPAVPSATRRTYRGRRYRCGLLDKPKGDGSMIMVRFQKPIYRVRGLDCAHDTPQIEPRRIASIDAVLAEVSWPASFGAMRRGPTPTVVGDTSRPARAMAKEQLSTTARCSW
jgi:hypothetical protein